jgi:uncharacterized protein
MIFFVISIAALLVSGLTMFSGFGLGTLLMPVFALFFPVEMAVALTAIVHGANNIFKMLFLARNANRSLIILFGVPAILTAFLGASLLSYISGMNEIAHYTIFSKTAVITPIKLIMAILMIFFSLFELIPSLKSIRFKEKHLIWGGLLSGFFGGLSGHQGALRSAFLVKTGISTEAFVATNAVIGFIVDITRILTYFFFFFLLKPELPVGPEQWPIVAVGTLSAFIGVLIGKRFMHKIKISAIQNLTGIMLFMIALALGAGII